MIIIIAGYGSVGRRHYNNIISIGGHQVSFYRSGRSVIENEHFEGVKAYSDFVEAMKSGAEAVIISNPTSKHLEIALQAAGQGCSIFMEKPISHSIEGVEDLGRKCKENNSKLLMGFQFRYHQTLQVLKKMIENNNIGEIINVSVHWGEYLPDWHPWEDYKKGYAARKDLGGGVVLTLSHPFDYMRWLFGEIEDVWSFTATNCGLNIDVTDNAIIGLRFESGALATITLDYGRRPPKHSMEFTATKGTALWDGISGKARVYRTEKGEWEELSPTEDFERNTMFLNEMKHFLEVAKGNEEPICTLEDGIRALKIALAVEESSKQGKVIHMEY